ncbi:unnamed protein product [Closterium sp. NIES-53]
MRHKQQDQQQQPQLKQPPLQQQQQQPEQQLQLQQPQGPLQVPPPMAPQVQQTTPHQVLLQVPQYPPLHTQQACPHSHPPLLNINQHCQCPAIIVTHPPTPLPPSFCSHPTAHPTSYPTAPHTAPPTAPHTAPPTAPHTAPPTAPHTAPPTAPHTAPPTAPHTAPPTAPHTAPHTAPPSSFHRPSQPPSLHPSLQPSPMPRHHLCYTPQHHPCSDPQCTCNSPLHPSAALLTYPEPSKPQASWPTTTTRQAPAADFPCPFPVPCCTSSMPPSSQYRDTFLHSSPAVEENTGYLALLQSPEAESPDTHTLQQRGFCTTQIQQRGSAHQQEAYLRSMAQENRGSVVLYDTQMNAEGRPRLHQEELGWEVQQLHEGCEEASESPLGRLAQSREEGGRQHQAESQWQAQKETQQEVHQQPQKQAEKQEHSDNSVLLDPSAGFPVNPYTSAHPTPQGETFPLPSVSDLKPCSRALLSAALHHDMFETSNQLAGSGGSSVAESEWSMHEDVGKGGLLEEMGLSKAQISKAHSLDGSESTSCFMHLDDFLGTSPGRDAWSGRPEHGWKERPQGAHWWDDLFPELL